jgi:recombination associated protein RdgC
MWFRNLIVYRVPAGSVPAAGDLETVLERHPLEPCGPLDMQTRGWIAPAHDGRHLFTAQGQHLIALGVDRKLLPGAIVRQVAEERARVLAIEQGHPVGRRQMRELRQRVGDELRTRALTRRHTTRAWVDSRCGLLTVDAASAARAEELIETLRANLGSLPATRLDTERSPAATLGAWLRLGDAPGPFTIGEDLELRAPDATRATVRYVRHPLERREIQSHLAAGKAVTRLALTWRDRVAFVLNDRLELKRLEFLGVHRESDAENEDVAAQFDAEFALMTGELAGLLGDLVEALGGERTGVDPLVEVAA